MSNADQDDAKLAAKIVKAMEDYRVATEMRNEKAVAAGRLLAEAQKRHPTKMAFARFLQLAGGVQVRRAHDLIGFALGLKDFEQHRIENAAAQQRHRDKLKAEKIEREKEKAALPKTDPKPKPKADAALRNAADGPVQSATTGSDKVEPVGDITAKEIDEQAATTSSGLAERSVFSRAIGGLRMFRGKSIAMLEGTHTLTELREAAAILKAVIDLETSKIETVPVPDTPTTAPISTTSTDDGLDLPACLDRKQNAGTTEQATKKRAAESITTEAR
ncbi:hypothetical protein [Bradyrhizobium sp. USDA 3364]